MTMVFGNESASVEEIDVILSKHSWVSIQEVNYRLDIPAGKSTFKLLVTGRDGTWVQITDSLKAMNGALLISFDDA